MEYPAREVQRGGLCFVLQSPGPELAEAMIDYLRTLSAETEYMMRTPEEVTFTPERERALLEEQRADPLAMMISAVQDGRVLGNVGIYCVADRAKTRHRASVGIGLRHEVWGKGLASLLMDEAIAAAKRMGFVQLELDVCAENERARALYRKKGFTEFGSIPRGFRMADGNWCDLVQMVLPLDAE